MNNLQRAVEELRIAFRNRFGNYGLYENREYMGYKDVMPEVESFLSDSIKNVLNDFVRETRVEKGKKTRHYQNISEENMYDDANTDGYNAALEEVQSKQREYLGE